MAWTTPGTATAGSVLTASFWNTNVRDNTNALYGGVRRLAYVTRTTAYTVSATSTGTGADIFASDLSFTADGTSTYKLVFQVGTFAETGTSAGSRVYVELTDGTNVVTSNWPILGDGDGTNRAVSDIHKTIFVTPAAGVATYNVIAFRTISNGNIYSSATAPTYLAAYGPILT